MRWIAALVMVAACAPRTMITTRPGSGSVSDSGSGSDTGSGSGSDTGSDTGSGSVSASDGPIDQRGGVVWSLLPAPHLQKAAPVPLVESVEAARGLVGRRDRREALAIALEMSAGITGATIVARSEVELIAWAQERGAWKSVEAIAPGDLIVFDRAVEGERASLVAVALGRDGRGVIEMMYVAKGVVRRGFVDPARPKVVRDRERRAVNTYLRHGADQPPGGTRYLAGELFAGVIGAR